MIRRSVAPFRTILHRSLGGALLLWLPQLADAQQRVPVYDVSATCRYDADIANGPESEQTCLRLEREARTNLEAQWANFAADDRAECSAESSAGGSPSYVDLLTCLQMSRDARALERQRKASAGQGKKKQ
jgi:hypothetical protein